MLIMIPIMKKCTEYQAPEMSTLIHTLVRYISAQHFHGRRLIVIYCVIPGIFFSKDRREEVIEIDEIPETILIDEANETIPLVTQGQWMKGCPEGGEQSFLFSLYSQLNSPTAPCPHDCGAAIPRSKGDFFALHVSLVF